MFVLPAITFWATDLRAACITPARGNPGAVFREETRCPGQKTGHQASAATHTVYDPDGRAVRVERYAGALVAADEAGSSLQDAGAPQSVSSTHYNDKGQRDSTTDADENTTTYTYDPYGDLATVSLPAVVDPAHPNDPPASPVYTYTYDDQGDLKTVADPLGNVTTYTYDAFGRKTSETLPAVVGPDGYTQATPVQTWRYNELGRLDQAVDFNGDASTYTYDDQGRLAEEDLYLPGRVPGVDAPDRTVTYAYDQYDPSGDGSYSDSTTVTDAGVATVVTDKYDRRGDLVEVDSPQGAVHYEYDPAAGVKVRTWTGPDPAAPVTDVRYAYDPFGRLAEVEVVRLGGAAATLQTTSYTYNPGVRSANRVWWSGASGW